jgi:hypothetical protein
MVRKRGATGNRAAEGGVWRRIRVREKGMTRCKSCGNQRRSVVAGAAEMRIVPVSPVCLSLRIFRRPGRVNQVGQECQQPLPPFSIRFGLFNTIDRHLYDRHLYAGLYGCRAYAKGNDISMTEAELTLRWREVLEASFNTEPGNDPIGFLRDTGGTLLRLGPSVAPRLFKENEHLRHQVYLWDSETGVIRTTGPGRDDSSPRPDDEEDE